MNNSEKNLTGFYRAIGTLPSVKYLENDRYSAISQTIGNWPQMIYNCHFENNPEENIRHLIETIALPNCNMLTICNENDFETFDQEKLREVSVFPVNFWTSMEVSGDQEINITGDSGFEFRQLTDLATISAFTDLVNSDMMKVLKIADGFFYQLSQKPQFGFYGLFTENELVSGLVTFTENNIAGLYFIVTKGSLRGKGLAEFLIGKTLNRLFEKGTERVVLQAVNKAVNLYSRIGFTAQKKLVILMKY